MCEVVSPREQEVFLLHLTDKSLEENTKRNRNIG
jgi:hypothetical protein